MNYREFSDLGWRVSEIGLGCWQIGWCWGEIIKEDDARSILKEALDNGVNFFDTLILTVMVEVKDFFQKY